LADAQSLLEQALISKSTKKYSDAEKFSTLANDLTVNSTRGYAASQNAIEAGEQQMRKAAENGYDTSAANALLSQAETDFSKGHYNMVKVLVGEAITSIGNNPSNSFPVYGIIGGIALGGTVVVIVLRKKIIPKRLQVEDEHDSVSDPLSDITSNSRPSPRPSSLIPKPSTPIPDEPVIPATTMERYVLSRMLTRILAEKPHLRPEDQAVLLYLAEKDGTAFESELRNKFLLPKTTIWRLVKRLQREGLIEITKAGGQNLIKLRW
jgi:uncharacterized membrane protein